MTNKLIIIAVITGLIIGIVSLGIEVKKLRAEEPASATDTRQQQNPSKFPDVWTAAGNRWDPYSELMQFQNEMNKLFHETFRDELWRMGNGENLYELNTDIKDNKNNYLISMDIPGMEKENINVEVRNNTLLVSGERKEDTQEENANYYRQERSFGYFTQRLPLPEDADSSEISVTYKNGVLKIAVPKLAKTKFQKEAIKIKVN